MKRNLFILMAVGALVLSSLACGVTIDAGDGFGINHVLGSGDVVSEERPVGSFNRLQFGGMGDVIIEFGDEESLAIEAEDNFMQYFEVELRGDTLFIGLEEGITLNPNRPINFYLTVVSLEEVGISGLGDVDIAAFEAEDFTVDISGLGDVALDGIEVERFNVQISGLGSMTVRDGSATIQDIGMSGGGDYNALDLESEAARINISGLGSATVWVTEDLDVNISGGGSVSYKGSPSVSMNNSGVGSINQLGE